MNLVPPRTPSVNGNNAYKQNQREIGRRSPSDLALIFAQAHIEYTRASAHAHSASETSLARGEAASCAPFVRQRRKPFLGVCQPSSSTTFECRNPMNHLKHEVRDSATTASVVAADRVNAMGDGSAAGEVRLPTSCTRRRARLAHTPHLPLAAFQTQTTIVVSAACDFVLIQPNS